MTPDELKSVYFLGIGGIGMSALARYFRLSGAMTEGYDRTPTALTDQLIAEGIAVHFEDDIRRIPPEPDLVVFTPAIPPDHKEFLWLREHGAVMKKRAEVLGLISSRYRTLAVAGTHGKTTTSTLITHLVHTCGISHISFLGGISKNYGTNFITGPGFPEVSPDKTVCIAEADEFDRSFLHLSPHIAVITSIDADHLDIYGDHGYLTKAFEDFTSRVGDRGYLLIKKGIPLEPRRNNDYRVYRYSVSEGGDFYAAGIRAGLEGTRFDFVTPSGIIHDLFLGVPGRFNLENAVAALAAVSFLGPEESLVRQALQSYRGVLRRFDFRIVRPGLVFIDDYAHHPEELKACILAVRELFPGKKITGVFQPHLFSRTRDLADDFAGSLALLDELVLMEIYPAREKPIAGVNSEMLLGKIPLKNKRILNRLEIPGFLFKTKPEILLTLGAGDIDQLVQPIVEQFSGAADGI